jgi:septal ring factor EnvC (AmiA/AmiB activator)
VSRTAAVKPPAPPLDRTGAATRRQIDRHVSAQAWEREQLADRLHSLRRVLPVLAQEMASARRQAAHLRLDNRRLTEQVRALRAQLEARR